MVSKISEEYIKNKKVSGGSSKKKMDLSIVIPVYNEKESVGQLYSRLNKTLSKLKIA